jgi:hypothetical protein
VGQRERQELLVERDADGIHQLAAILDRPDRAPLHHVIPWLRTCRAGGPPTGIDAG